MHGRRLPNSWHETGAAGEQGVIVGHSNGMLISKHSHAPV